MIFAFLTAIMNSLENILDRLILRSKKVSFRHYLAISLTVIFLLCALAWPFAGRLDTAFFTSQYLWLFAGVIFVAFFYNIFFFYAISKEELCDVEPFVLLDRPLTVIMAALFFPSERSFWPLVLTLVAASALVLSRIDFKNLKVKVKKTTWMLAAFVILISLESQMIKVLLTVASPVSLYCLRTGVLALLFWVILRPNMKKVTKTETRNISLNGAITFVEFTARFYAIAYLGIVKSTLVLLLSPVITLTFSRFFMKEHFTAKKVIADIIIIVCVAATLFLH